MGWVTKILVALAAIPQGSSFTPRHAALINRRPRVLRAEGDNRVMSWQESFEKVLNPFTGLAEKQVMVQDLIARREEVFADVADAASSGSTENLFPEGTEARRAASGAAAVQRQVQDDILPALLEEPGAILQSLFGQVASRGPVLAMEAADALTKEGGAAELTAKLSKAAADPAAVAERLKDEVLNVVSSTPVGLEAPPYTLVSMGDGFEVRDYATFTVVRTPMGAPRAESPTGMYQGGTFTGNPSSEVEEEAEEVDQDTGSAPPAADDAAWTFSSLPASGDKPLERFGPVEMALASGDGFNRLASYIFGDNDAGEVLEMTTPVATSYRGTSPTGMAFYLTTSANEDKDGEEGGGGGGEGGGTAAAAAAAEPSKATPNPTNARVYVSRVVPQRAAVREFQGFATEGEIKRQLLELKSRLAMSGLAPETGPNGEDIYQVLQYNPPWTVPVLRKNEIAVRLRYNTEDGGTAAQGNWAVETEDKMALQEAAASADYDDGCPSD